MSDDSDIELVLPPPLPRATSSSRPPAPAPARASRPPSSSQPVPAKHQVIDIDSADEDSDNGGDTPPRAGAGSRGLKKAVSAPSAFGGNGRARSTENSDGEESDDLPDLGTVGLLSGGRGSQGSANGATSRAKGKGRVLSPIPGSSAPHLDSVMLTDTDKGSSSDEEPAKKKPRKKASVDKGEGTSTGKTKEQEKLEKKKAKEREKAEKATATAIEKEAKNALKNSNVLRTRDKAPQELQVDISTSLLEEGTPFRAKMYIELAARLKAVDCRYNERRPRSGCHGKTIHWKRNVTKDWDPQRRFFRPRKESDYTLEEEPTVLIYLSTADVEEAVEASKTNRSGTGEGTLVDIVGKARQFHGADYQVFLLIQNLNEKAKAKKSADNASWQAEARGGAADTGKGKSRKKEKFNSNVSMEDIEMELVRVTVAERCFVIRAEKYEEAVDWLVELTKDIAYRPYKRIERAREAYLNIDGKIESSSQGNLKTTYINQLACINGVTEPMAIAIAHQYATWRRLLNGYEECSSVKEKELMLQHIPIGNNRNGAATDRTIGKVASERIYIVLFNPNRNLDLSGNIKSVRGQL